MPLPAAASTGGSTLPIPSRARTLAGRFLSVRFLSGLLAVALLLCPPPGATVAPASAAVSAVAGEGSRYLCDGDPLVATPISGAVDAQGIGNQSRGTRPGDGMLLRWRDQRLQLPRTNNAGPPSYTDGRWWWSEEDPIRPVFRLRRAEVVEFRCIREGEDG